MTIGILPIFSIYFISLSTDFKAVQLTQIADVIHGLKSLNITKPADFDEQISRYSAFMCFAILASAAEGKHFKAAKEIKKLINNSLHREEIKKARFDKITTKSKIAIFLMKRNLYTLACRFLYICKRIKQIKEGK